MSRDRRPRSTLPTLFYQGRIGAPGLVSGWVGGEHLPCWRRPNGSGDHPSWRRPIAAVSGVVLMPIDVRAVAAKLRPYPTAAACHCHRVTGVGVIYGRFRSMACASNATRRRPDLWSVLVGYASGTGEIRAGDLGRIHFAGAACHGLEQFMERGCFTLDEAQRVDPCHYKRL
jgi:hypothetical protein